MISYAFNIKVIDALEEENIAFRAEAAARAGLSGAITSPDKKEKECCVFSGHVSILAPCVLSARGDSMEYVWPSIDRRN